MMRLTVAVVETFPGYGEVILQPRHNNVRIILRRDGKGGYRASVPYGSDYKAVIEAVSRMLPRLEAKKKDSHTPRFCLNQSIEFDGGCIYIRETTRKHGRIVASTRGSDIVIGVGEGVDVSSGESAAVISGLIRRCAVHIAPPILIPRAREVAARLGVAPTTWKIGRGVSVLGTFHSSDGHISLSGMLLFLPVELRDYIVCHELAHITHRDHSPDFHSLCNRYCGGREKELAARLRAWQWPILR